MKNKILLTSKDYSKATISEHRFNVEKVRTPSNGFSNETISFFGCFKHDE
jgi:hypothetical protein